MLKPRPPTSDRRSPDAAEFRTPIGEMFLDMRGTHKDEVCHYTYREVGDLELDGMQGDTVAYGQQWQTFSPPSSTRSLKFEENLKREFAETGICNTI